MRLADLELMRAMPLVAGLEEQHVDRLLHLAAVQRHLPGTILFEQGDSPECLHVILSGTVELFTGTPPKECGLVLLGTEDVFMPAASLFGEPYINSARVLTPARILRLDAAVVRETFTRSHQFAINMSRVLAGQFRMATRHIIDLRCRSASQRLAAFLLRLVDESPIPEGAQLPVQKKQLASRVGMSAETLSRTLRILAENGLLVRGSRISVHNREQIEAFCGPALYPDTAESALGVHAR